MFNALEGMREKERERRRIIINVGSPFAPANENNYNFFDSAGGFRHEISYVNLLERTYDVLIYKYLPRISISSEMFSLMRTLYVI